MLVNLSKDQIESLCDFIAYNNDIDKDIDVIYDKLKSISNSCECKSQKEN